MPASTHPTKETRDLSFCVSMLHLLLPFFAPSYLPLLLVPPLPSRRSADLQTLVYAKDVAPEFTFLQDLQGLTEVRAKLRATCVHLPLFASLALCRSSFSSCVCVFSRSVCLSLAPSISLLLFFLFFFFFHSALPAFAVVTFPLLHACV